MAEENRINGEPSKVEMLLDALAHPNASKEGIEPLLQFLTEAHVAGEKEKERLLKNPNTLDAAVISALSDDSYKALSPAAQKVYDVFSGISGTHQTVPISVSTRPPGSRTVVNTLEHKGDIHWEDLLKMLDYANLENLHTTPSEYALNHPDRYQVSEENPDYFRAHAKGQNIYIPPFNPRVVKKGEGMFGFDDVYLITESRAKRGEIPGLDENSTEEEIYKYINDNYRSSAREEFVGDLLAELAHLEPGNWGRTPEGRHQTALDRMKRSEEEGGKTDYSNYESASDKEYHTHFSPEGSEKRLFDMFKFSNRLEGDAETPPEEISSGERLLRNLALSAKRGFDSVTREEGGVVEKEPPSWWNKLMSYFGYGGGKAASIAGEVGEAAATKAKEPKVVKDPSHFDAQAFKDAIRRAETLGYPTNYMNPNSSATGQYQPLFDLIPSEVTGGVTKEEFANSTELQEKVMDVMINEGWEGNRSMKRHVKEVWSEYSPQFDEMPVSPLELAMVIYKEGRQGAREWLASIRDGGEVRPPTDAEHNMSTWGYLNKGLNRDNGGVINGDDEEYSIRPEDIYKYLEGKGVNLRGREIATTRIMPGRSEYFLYGNAPTGSKESDDEASTEEAIRNHDTVLGIQQGKSFMDDDFRRHNIIMSAKRAGDEDVRVEEDIHSIQPIIGTLIKGMGKSKRQLARMLKDQYFEFDENTGSESFKSLSDQEKSDLYKENLVSENYALRGMGSSKEFEAKLISDKMQMINQGVIPKDGVVGEEHLMGIQNWYSNQSDDANFLGVLFKNIDASPKYTKTLLKTLNKA